MAEVPALPPLPADFRLATADLELLLQRHATYGEQLHRLLRQKAEADAADRHLDRKVDDLAFEADVRLRRARGESHQTIGIAYGMTKKMVAKFCNERGIGKWAAATEEVG